MDLNINKLLAKLSFLRNLGAYILPLVLFAIAIIALFPALFLSRGLKADVKKQSIAKGKTVKSYSSAGIARDQWKVEQRYQEAYASDANDINGLWTRTSQRELLSYDIFPEPNESSIWIFEEFGRRYQRAAEELITTLGGRECPTVDELEQALASSSSGRESSMRRNTRSGYGGREVMSIEASSPVEKNIIEEICLEAAEDTSFYVSALDLPGYEFWDTSGVVAKDTGASEVTYQYKSIEQSVQVCWYWQLGYWILEDVLMSINSLNSDCKDVLNCPVKRLTVLSFVPGSGQSRSTSDDFTGGGPLYVMSKSEGLTESHTGRLSDEEIDVVHFQVTVLVSADGATSFMEELCSAKKHSFSGWDGTGPAQRFEHNQITILQVLIEPVDREGEEHQYYRYGSSGVVELDLICEYVFNRSGYDVIKPEKIKESDTEEE